MPSSSNPRQSMRALGWVFRGLIVAAGWALAFTLFWFVNRAVLDRLADEFGRAGADTFLWGAVLGGRGLVVYPLPLVLWVGLGGASRTAGGAPARPRPEYGSCVAAFSVSEGTRMPRLQAVPSVAERVCAW